MSKTRELKPLIKKYNVIRSVLTKLILETLEPFNVKNLEDVKYLLLDKEKFLTNIKDRESQSVLVQIHNIPIKKVHTTFLRILKPFGIKTYKEAQDFLQDKNISSLLEMTGHVKNVEEVLDILKEREKKIEE